MDQINSTCILSETDVIKYLPMNVTIDLMHDLFVGVAGGKVNQPLRTFLSLPNDSVFGSMPCSITTPNGETYFGTKLISLFPKNQQPVPTIQGVILLFGAGKYLGQPLAMLEASSVTAIRTAAASGLATRLLAKSDANGPLTCAIIGTGVQAESHVEAMLTVRNISKIFLSGRSFDKVQQLATKLKKIYSTKYHELQFFACKTTEEAVKDADIICTVTASSTPVLEHKWLKPGVHINAVGAHGASKREIDSHTMLHSSVWADSKTSILAEGGDFLIPIKEGLYTESHLKGDLAELVSKKKNGRTSAQEITVFNSLGLAIEDLQCAIYLYHRSKDVAKSNSVRMMSRL